MTAVPPRTFPGRQVPHSASPESLIMRILPSASASSGLSPVAPRGGAAATPPTRSQRISRAAPVMGAVCCLFVSACGTDAPAGPTFTLRDSAGIAIATNRGDLPVDGGGWRVSAEPTLEIGTMEGDEAYLLFRVWGATRLSDGRIAVANNRAPDIRIFDPEGRHLHTFGRRGEGPEDFDSPVLMGKLPGDTLVVVDRLLRRINLYHPEEGFIRGATAAPEIQGYLLTVGMFASGSVLVQRTEWTEDLPNGFFRFPTRYRSVALDGSLEHDFGDFPGNETIYSAREVEGGTMTLSSGRPFGKVPQAAVTGNRFFYGSQDTYEIQVRSQGGTLTRLIRREMPLQPVTDAHVAAVMEEMIDEADDSEQTREFRRMFREAPIPEFHPAFGYVYADALGCLWVEEYRLPGEEARVTTIFDRDGRMVGSVTLPTRFQAYEIGEDYLLGRWVDELGVERIRVYGLTRPDRPAYPEIPGRPEGASRPQGARLAASASLPPTRR